ncbi:MAG: 16S rRNA (guanine(966)-N(2))-methyltransferase RsmD [Candidatus Hydrogenedentes bacterium]|jgi:16S rRNA (guanine966-N2)-methyltransferase|nr:16S rRNA (guanine(966)-N(2))-methyltransferase RsmD [Candidatus Hydrogenedentota bacterium]
MRIVAGSLKGRRLLTPQNKLIRPTSDRVRENLFNILGVRVIDTHFLDLYSGVGACGIEALSRGAAHATFIDNAPEALKLVRRNLEKCDVAIQAMVIQAHLPDGLPRSMPPFSIIFADPPYADDQQERLLEAIAERNLLLPDGRIIIESGRRDPLPEQAACYRRVDQRIYGESCLSFFA